MVNTRFWDDAYISDLDPIEKLMFLYMLTNTSTNVSGVYEIPVKKIANETGLDKEMVEKIVKRFSRDKKIYYKDGWVAIRNFIKHQNQKSPLIQKGIEIELEKAPQHIKDLINGKGIDTLSHLTKPNLTKPNLKEAPSADEEKASSLAPEVIKAFEAVDPKNKTNYSNKTQRSAADFLVSEYGLEQVLAAIAVLPHTNKMPYMPSITTPYELKEKWVKLQDAMRRKNVEPNKPKRVVLSTIK